MSDSLQIRVTVKGLPTGVGADGVAAMLEALGAEAVRVVEDARPLPRGASGSMSTLGVVVDYDARSVDIATQGTGHGAYVRRSDDTTRMTRRDYSKRQPRKSVTIGTELGRDLSARVEDVSRALPDNVALAVLAEVIERAALEKVQKRQARAARKRGRKKVR